MYYSYKQNEVKFAYLKTVSIAWVQTVQNPEIVRIAFAFRSKNDQHNKPEVRKLLISRLMNDKNIFSTWRNITSKVGYRSVLTSILNLKNNKPYLEDHPQQRSILTREIKESISSPDWLKSAVDNILVVTREEPKNYLAGTSRIVFKHFPEEKLSIGIAVFDRAIKYVFATCSKKDQFCKQTARDLITERFNKGYLYSGAVYYNSPITNYKHDDVWKAVAHDVRRKTSQAAPSMMWVPPSATERVKNLFMNVIKNEK